MFDQDNQTNEEEILEQNISEVLVKTKNMADQIRLTQEMAAQAEAATEASGGAFGGA